MKEKILDILRVSTHYPRKLLDVIIYNFYFKNRNNWEALKQFKERPVLVVGNGPSLNKTPLSELQDDFVSIGMNKINLLYEKSSWRPEIITCVNGLVIRQNKDYFNQTKAILILPVKAFYLGIKPRKNVIFVNLKDSGKVEPNIEKHLSSGCTVTFTAIQIAAYLNPKSVNIVGVDHSFIYDKDKNNSLVQKYEGDDVNHFSKDYFKNHYWGLPDLDGSEILYQASKDYFDNIQTPITDYTVDGKLQIFEKGDINDILKSKKVSAQS